MCWLAPLHPPREAFSLARLGEVINVRSDSAIMVNVKPNTWLTLEALELAGAVWGLWESRSCSLALFVGCCLLSLLVLVGWKGKKNRFVLPECGVQRVSSRVQF